jgi:hypothetical protein
MAGWPWPIIMTEGPEKIFLIVDCGMELVLGVREGRWMIHSRRERSSIHTIDIIDGMAVRKSILANARENSPGTSTLMKEFS